MPGHCRALQVESHELSHVMSCHAPLLWFSNITDKNTKHLNVVHAILEPFSHQHGPLDKNRPPCVVYGSKMLKFCCGIS